MRPSRFAHRRDLSTAATLFAALFALTACGTDSPVETSVLPDPATFQELTFVQARGFTAISPPGSACDVNEPQTTTVTSSPATLSWNYCVIGVASQMPETRVGSRALTATELKRITHALQLVTVTEQRECYEDVGRPAALDVKTTAGVALYSDNLTSGCTLGAPTGRAFVTGLDDLVDAMFALIPPSQWG